MNNDDFTTNPPQGIQATLDLLYLWNPDVAKELIERLEQEIVEGRKLLPLSGLTAPIEEYDPCFYGTDICIARRHMDVVPDEPTEEDWYILHCKIDDVTVDGTSVVNNGIAAINLTGKVDKTDSASVVYGTDEYGNQTTYPATSFGAVDDVQVNGVSVVENKIASVTVPTKTSDIQNDSDYQTGTEVDTTVSSAITTHNGSSDAHSNLITPITQDITAIEGKIPAQASSENKLADKNFVNSSISTNTANFIGTFNSVEDLEAYSGTLTNNDYAFVISTDSAGNTVYNRYKYTTATTPASWQFEYALNNSSFTAEQWAAINSGATTTNIGQIATNTTAIQGKLDKVTSASGTTQVYAKDMNGSQVMLDTAQGSAGFNTLARRTATGTLRVATPTDNADATTKLYVDTALSSKADTSDVATISLNNLNSTGKNIANWSSNVSNCITEIPQDIKLELNNGTLKLKSGSKVYGPNGTDIFDTVNITADKTVSTGLNNGQNFLCLNKTTLTIQGRPISNAVSGPGATTTAGFAYDTTANKIGFYNLSGELLNYTTFPFCIVNVESGVITSIDQVFNGAGYIGHHAFVLPNVYALCPTGRNSDGTLKSQARTTTNVAVIEMGTGYYQGYNRRISIIGGNPANGTGSYIEIADRSELQQKDWVRQYIVSENIIVAWTGSQYVEFLVGAYPPQTPFIEYMYDGTSVKLFSVKNVFRTLDENDTEFIGHQAAPSSRYVNLAWPSSGDTIKAPADGYFTLLRLSGATGEFAYFSNASSGLTIGVNAGGAGLNQRLTCRVSKGDIITIGYNLTGSATYLRFVYANGAK